MNYFWILKKHNSSFNNFGAHVKSILKKYMLALTISFSMENMNGIYIYMADLG